MVDCHQIQKSNHALFIILLLFWILDQSIAQEATQPNTLFFQGNSYYKEERYAEAIKAYEQLVSMGIKDGYLYYNLGNAYFKIGNRGKVILNYERALQLLPRDADVNSNLDYALSLVEGNPTARLNNGLLSKVLVLEHLLNMDELTVAVILLYVGLMVVLTFSILLKRARRALHYTAAIFGCLLLFSLISFSLELYKIQFQREAVIISEAAAVRFEPSGDATSHFTLYEGAVIRVKELQQEWSKIERWDGKSGWLKNDTFEVF
jgi:tetratricopeptide (TPR) repeat protein